MAGKDRENRDTIDKQQTQIEEMERRIKVLEGDLEAAEDENEENKKLEQDAQCVLNIIFSLQESYRAGILFDYSNQ